MKIVTFVWYPFMPIPCEGNDDDRTTRSFNLRLRNEERVEKAIATLESRYGGYVQCWEVK